MADNNRFEVTYSCTHGMMQNTQILVDKETGVQYVFHQCGYGGGMTVLLDKDGKPVVTPVTK